MLCWSWKKLICMDMLTILLSIFILPTLDGNNNIRYTFMSIVLICINIRCIYAIISRSADNIGCIFYFTLALMTPVIWVASENILAWLCHGR